MVAILYNSTHLHVLFLPLHLLASALPDRAPQARGLAHEEAIRQRS